MLIRKTTEHYWPLGGSPLITPPLARPRHEGSGAERRAGSRLRRRGHPMGRSGTGDEGDRASSRRTGTAQKRHPRNGSGGGPPDPLTAVIHPQIFIYVCFFLTLYQYLKLLSLASREGPSAAFRASSIQPHTSTKTSRVLRCRAAPHGPLSPVPAPKTPVTSLCSVFFTETNERMNERMPQSAHSSYTCSK